MRMVAHSGAQRGGRAAQPAGDLEIFQCSEPRAQRNTGHPLVAALHCVGPRKNDEKYLVALH